MGLAFLILAGLAVLALWSIAGSVKLLAQAQSMVGLFYWKWAKEQWGDDFPPSAEEIAKDAERVAKIAKEVK